MKTFAILLFWLFTGFLISGCARDNSDKLALLDAIATSAAKCQGEPGCIATLNAAIYSGALDRQEDGPVRIISAFIPYLNIGLELTRILHGGSGGSGQGFVLNRSSNNTFIMPKNSADRGSHIDSPFDATASVSRTQSWENMSNVDRSTNQ